MEPGGLRPMVHGQAQQGVPFPALCEIIYIRVDVSRFGGTATVPSQTQATSAGGPSQAEGNDNRFRPHPVIVVDVLRGQGDWSVVGFVMRSYSHMPDAINFVATLPVADRSLHIPMPHQQRDLTTPGAFGVPLRVSGMEMMKPTWVYTSTTVTVRMGGNGKYRRFNPQRYVPPTEIGRLDRYARSMTAAEEKEAAVSSLSPSSSGSSGLGAWANGPPGDPAPNSSASNDAAGAAAGAGAGSGTHTAPFNVELVCYGAWHRPGDPDDDDDDDADWEMDDDVSMSPGDMVLSWFPDSDLASRIRSDRSEQLNGRVFSWASGIVA